MAENEIQKVTAITLRERALGHPTWVRAMAQESEIVAQIGRVMPGKMENDERQMKVRSLLEQVSIHISNSQACQQICQCLGESVIQTITDMATLDLSPHKAGGECYIIPFKNIATLMVGYKGFIKLICRAGDITGIKSVVVYEGEHFEWKQTDERTIIDHTPSLDLQGDESKIKAVYAVAYVKDGPNLVEVMNRKQIDKIHNASKSKNSPAYRQWKIQMVRKAPIRRLQNYIPKTGDNPAVRILEQALEIDNKQYTVEETDAAREALQEQSRGRLAAARGDAPPAEPERAADGEVIPDQPMGEPS